MASEDDFSKFPQAQGEDVKERPQPADDPTETAPSSEHADLIEKMSKTLKRLDSDDTTRGD